MEELSQAQRADAARPDSEPETGAESAVRALVAAGIDTCFANPGTSEMHFVSALDRVAGIRPVLALHEGVATGAADGYGRMAGRAATTLLHAGPGLFNGASNLHNARRAGTALLNIVGDHATYHRALDSPLTTELETIADTCSDVVVSATDAAGLAQAAVEAVAVSRAKGGQVTSLLLPADTAWGRAGDWAVPAAAAATPPDPDAIAAAARALAAAGLRGALVLGRRGLDDASLVAADALRQAVGTRLLCSNLVPRLARGAGSIAIETIPYAVDEALAFLAGFDTLVLVDAPEPVAFFAYPGKPGRLAPDGCTRISLTPDGSAVPAALEALCAALSAPTRPPRRLAPEPPSHATGALAPEALGRSIAACMPPGTVLVEESVSAGRELAGGLDRSRGHDVLRNMGGSIGFGLPAAVGAAVACPDRKVICIEADGSAMYTQQALWSLAREGLDVLVVILANRRYQILRAEMRNVQASEPGPRARTMLEIDRPTIDWVALARAQGVPADSATTMETFNKLVTAAARPGAGPFLIEAVY